MSRLKKKIRCDLRSSEKHHEVFYLLVSGMQEKKPDHPIRNSTIKLHHSALKPSSCNLSFFFSIGGFLHARTYLHVCSRRRVREVVRARMPFPVCLCLRDESPGRVTGVKPPTI